MQDPKGSLGFLLHDVARLMRRNFARHTQVLDLTPAQCKALAYAGRYEGLNQAQLADLMDIQPMSAGRLIDHLEERGLLERRPDPKDRRALRIHITDTAAPTLDKIWELVASSRNVAMAGLPEDTRKHMILAMQHMRRNLIAAEGEVETWPQASSAPERDT